MNPSEHSEIPRWRSCTSLAISRSHPATAVFEGKIYVFGGGGPGFEGLNSVELYEPEMDRWSRLRDMPTRRSGAVALVHSGKVFVIGGGIKQPNGKFRFLRTVEVYDPQRDLWESGPDLIEPHDYPAGAVLDGHLYIIGGHHPDATEGGPQTDPGFSFAERLDPGRGSWEALAPLPTPRFAATGVVLDHSVYCLGGVAFTPWGFKEFDCVERYDPIDRQWFRETWQLPWPCAAHGAAVVSDRLYILGGFSGDSGIGTQTAVYRFSDGRWSVLPPLPSPRAAMGVAVVGQTLYLIGGWSADRSVLGTVIAYSSPWGPV